MSKSLNRCEFIGNLTKDVETKYMPNGNAVTQFSIACNDSYRDKNTGETVETTEYPTRVAFGKLAEIMAEYLKKGSKVYVAGKFKNEKYTDNSRVTKYFTKFIANEMLMLDGRSDGQGAARSEADEQGSAGSNHGQQSAPPANPDDFEDIPFD